jgi:hypothetical protein
MLHSLNHYIAYTETDGEDSLGCTAILMSVNGDTLDL